MTVILINPNSTEAMTRSALSAARRTSPGISFEGWTSMQGPPVIEGAKDGAAALPPLLELVREASDAGASAIVIACFDDTGLARAQQVASCPVIGIGQASFVMADLMSGPTAVVTTVEAAVPVIKANISGSGHGHVVRSVVAAHVPVLILEDDPKSAVDAFAAAARTLPKDTANLILGCAGAVTIAEDIRERFSLNVIDGVTAAARLCRALVI